MPVSTFRKPKQGSGGRIVAASVVGAMFSMLAMASPASAACWIDRERPTTADSQPVTSPRVAVTRSFAQAINGVLKANTTLQALPDVRIRSTWQITGHPRTTPGPYGLHLVLWAHGKETWAAGTCALIPQADRVDPNAAIVVQTNSVTSTLSQLVSYVRDDQLEAFIEPERIGQVGKYPVYRGQWIVLTFDGRLPWVPLTMGEYLAFEERRMVKEYEEAERNIAASSKPVQLDENELRKAYEAMKAVNPAEAEKFLAMMAEVRKSAARASAEAKPVTNGFARPLQEVRALRASLSPAELQQQAREGYTSRTPLAPIEKLPRLVKLDPSFPWDRANPNRIRMMEIHFSGRGAPYADMMRRVVDTLDWAAIEATMR